jgi:DNA-binding NarL/FixJ family response regulator
VVRVLVVDDHAMLAEAFTAALAGAGMEVCGTAGSVADALDAVATTTPDVVVLDYQLPDGTAVDVMEALGDGDGRPRVLVVSGRGDDRAVADAVRCGGSGFLAKTSPLRDLVDAVRSVHAGGAVFDAVALRAAMGVLSADDAAAPGADLSPREREVLAYLCNGRDPAAIAAALGLSVNTVRNHVQHVLAKLGAHSQLEAVAIAFREGLVPRP